MLSWFFKKWKAPAAPLAAPVTSEVARAEAQQAVRAKAEVRARQSAEARSEWQARLQAAAGDDEALLAVARSATVLDIKLAAVQALVAEPALLQAEREFRSHDRKVHRVAKQRLESAVAQRSTRARAQALIASAQALLDQAPVAVNHLVALDRDWQGLDPSWIEAPQQALFTDLRQRIASAVQSQSGQQQVSQRWLADAVQAREALRQDCVAAAAGASHIDLTAHQTLIAGLQAACPAAPAAAVLSQTLASALQIAALLPERLALLAALEQPEPAEPGPIPEALEAPEPPEPSVAPAAPEHLAEALPSDLGDAVPAPNDASAMPPPPPPTGTAERWQALEALPDAELADLLAQRFARWQRAQPAALAALSPQAAPAPARRPAQAKPGRASPQGPNAEQTDRLDALLRQAEAAGAEGQLGPLQQHLQAFDAALAALPGVSLAQPSGEGLRNRLQALHAERSRLKDWQQWGSGRAREDLLAEAEALARLTLAAAGGLAPAPADPVATAVAGPGGESAEAGSPADLPAGLPAGLPADSPADLLTETASDLPAEPPAKTPGATAVGPQPRPAAGAPATRVLNLKAHGDAIQALRNRWKALDRLGADASQALWQGFDAALHTAYQPLALRQAAVKAARQDNLLAREALLAELESWAAPLPPATADAPNDPPTHPPTHPPTNSPPDPQADAPGEAWKSRLRALDRFNTAWRQLGPVEHTVPAAARDGLSRRHRQALDRIELPLLQARQAAAARREQLIERAQALSGGAATAPAAFDAPQQVRSLQAEWQQQARGLPLARQVENALWSRFKTATDAVFLQRDAALSARDAELGANLAEREAWLQRLAALVAEPWPDPAPALTNPAGHSADPQHPDRDAADALRTLAEIDRAWRQAVDLPRGAAAALESRYRDARNAVQQRLSAASRQRWQAGWDALSGRLALCEAREAGESQNGQNNQNSQNSQNSPDASAPPDATQPDAARPLDVAARWAALPAWPGVCADALARRWQAPLGALPKPQPEVDSWLLALEVALDMPAGPAQQAARQQLKLLALKNALEGRNAGSQAPQHSPLHCLAAVLGQAGLGGAQRERLRAVLAALRQAPAGALGLALPRG